MRNKAISAAVAVALTLGGAMATGSWAAGSVQSLDTAVAADDAGRHLTVKGTLACTQAEAYKLRVTVTQRGSGALAEGRDSGDCGTTSRAWDVKATRSGRAAFADGAARACAVLTTRKGDRMTDAHQWCQDVTIR